MRLAELPADFRDRAEHLRECGAEVQALTLEWAAERTEEALKGAMDEELTLDQAEIESGYTRRSLRQMIQAGKIPAAGRGRGLRIQRRHLPKKPGVASSGPGLTFRSQLARTVAAGGDA